MSGAHVSVLRTRGRASALTHDVFRFLVVPKPEESGVPQFAIRRPFGEGDLGNEPWVHPMNATARQVIVLERADRCPQFGKLLAESAQRGAVEAGPDLAGIDKLSPAVIAQQQCPKTDSAPLRLGISADDEFLLAGALEFQPVARSLGDVCTVSILCDHPLPSMSARFSIVGFSLGLTMVGEPQRPFEPEGISKELLAVSERNLPRVVALEIDHIEQIEPYRDLADQVGRRMRDLHALLQLGKAGDPILERDDFPIGDKGAGLLLI